jgi:26S proteasome regulatory subunit N2
MLIPS